MEELSRVDPAEDPYLALRTTLGVVIGLMLAEPLGITQPMMVAALGMSMMSGQRGKFTARTLAGPLMIPVIAYVFSFIAALTVSDPTVFVLVNLLFAALGFSLMMFRGSRGGVLFTVFPAMMSCSVVVSDQVLPFIRDAMVSGGLLTGALIVATNLLFPPKTKRVHVDQPSVTPLEKPVTALLIRLAVYMPVLLWTFAQGDMNLMILPIMLVFVCGEADRGGRTMQFVDRGGATLIGAGFAVAIMAVYYVVPQLPVLLCLVGLCTYYLIDKMTTGKRRPLLYQYTCSVALVLALSSITGTRDAFEVVFQRVALTTGSMLVAIAAIALLEAIFVPRPAAPEPAAA